ncbi:MAG: DUF354 domain-containing protein [Acidobacteriota bacterium]
MRILVDLTHPAHVHFFRHPIAAWRARGHDVVLTTRDKDLAVGLVERFGLEPLVFDGGRVRSGHLGRARSGLAGLAVELVGRTARLLQIIRRAKPDVMAAIGGVFIAQAGFWSRVPSVVFYDTEHATLQNALTYPFCTAVATPRCYGGWVPKRKHVAYAGYHELAYTHPRYFTPDPGRLGAFGLSADEPFTVLRLVSWGASHDVADHGFTGVRDAVETLERFGRVVISSEAELPPELESRRLSGPLEDVHHLLALARLVIGESATMASEAATLGTPAIFVSTSRRGYTDEQQERYGLVWTFDHPRDGQRLALDKAVELLSATSSDGSSDGPWAEKRRALLQDTVDVTDFVVELVESHG